MPDAALPPVPDSASGGRLVENIMHFARTLRAAGLRSNRAAASQAARAVEAVATTS